MAEEKPSKKVLTRAARRKAGLPPPTPLFRGPSSKFMKKEALKLEAGQDPSLEKLACPRQDDSGCDSDSSDDEQIVWVQCDNKDCQKWRKLPLDSGTDLSQDWYCRMHPDPTYQSCDRPEEKWVVSKKRAFTFSRLHPGQLIWAKMRGYSPWPAIVSQDPWSNGGREYICEEREGCIYHVEFLGKPRTHTWIPEEQVEPYHNGYSCSLGAIGKSKKLKFAQHEAESYLTLSNDQRMEKCEYQKTTIVAATETAPQKRKNDSLVSAKPRKCGRPPGKSYSKVKKEPCGDTTNSQGLLHSTTSHMAPHQSKLNAQVPSLFESVGNNKDGLSSHVSLLQCLGIPLTQGNMFNMAGVMLQNSLLQGLQSQMSGGRVVTSNDIKPTNQIPACLQQPAIVPSISTMSTQVTTSRTGVISGSQQDIVPTNPCDYLQKSWSLQKLAQNQQLVPPSSQGLTGNKTVQLTGGKRKKANGASSNKNKMVSKEKTKGAQKKNSSSTKCILVGNDSNNIQKYFKSPRDREWCLNGPIPGILTTAQSSVKDQLVPEGSVVHLESEAQSEMMEIEEMLSSFGGDTTCLSSGEPPAVESGNKGTSTLTETSLPPDVDIDSMLNEMSQIEGLIEDLSKGQVLPY